MRVLVEMYLTKAGHVVEMVEDGDLALARLNEDVKYDVLLTDNQMPRMSGLVLLKLLRLDSRFDELPIIVFSMDAIERTVVDLDGMYADKSDLKSLDDALKKAAS